MGRTRTRGDPPLSARKGTGLFHGDRKFHSIFIARAFDLAERTEDLVVLATWDPRSAILDCDNGAVGFGGQADLCATSILNVRELRGTGNWKARNRPRFLKIG
jgi:hypothetical protein